jgi:hypothetical protein
MWGSESSAPLLLFFQRIQDHLWPVTQEENSIGAATIDVPILVNVPDIWALSSLGVEGVWFEFAGQAEQSSRYNILRALPKSS